MQFRDYLRYRRLAFALKELRNTKNGILDIALKYGFSSQEAFTRAFKEAYAVTPSEYRQNPKPVALRTIIKPFDCYLLGIGGCGMEKSTEDIKIYFVTIPAHKFLHIKNFESIGYWDFWQKQNLIPEQDCKTICGLLDSIEGKVEVVRLWHISMSRQAESAVGGFLLQNAMVCAFRQIIVAMCHRKCF